MFDIRCHGVWINICKQILQPHWLLLLAIIAQLFFKKT